MSARTFGQIMMALGVALVVVFYLSLLGCATTQPAPEVRTVKETLTVAVSCAPDAIPEPEWATRRLKPDASLDDAVKAITAEMEQRKAYELKVAAALEACRSLPKP